MAASPERGAPGLRARGLGAVGGACARARADPCGAGASRVGAERLERTSPRIILHLRRLSVAVLAEGRWVDSVPLGAHVSPSSISPPAIRAARNASTRRGRKERGCPGVHPGGLGVLNARDTSCPQPAECPAVRRCTGPAPSHRLRSARSVSRRTGGAGRSCWAVLGPRVWWRPSPKGAHELLRLRMCLELRRHSWHGVTSLLVPPSERRDPPRPWSPYATGTRPLRRPRPLGGHDEPQRPEPPPASACCWYV